MDEFITVAEAAKEFDVTDVRIYRWLRDGRLTKYERKFDGLTMVRVAELRDLLQSMNEIVQKEEK